MYMDRSDAKLKYEIIHFFKKSTLYITNTEFKEYYKVDLVSLSVTFG